MARILRQDLSIGNQPFRFRNVLTYGTYMVSYIELHQARGKLMRKKTINPISANISPFGQAWLDLHRLAQIEITSESAPHPIAAALTPGFSTGWQAGEPGDQTSRRIF